MQDKPANHPTPETSETPLLRLGPGGDFTRDVHADELLGTDAARVDYTREVLLCNSVTIPNDPFTVPMPAIWSVAD